MTSVFKIALRNLLRYKRRTALTATLVTLGVIFVLVFTSIAGSFKQMIHQIQTHAGNCRFPAKASGAIEAAPT